MDDDQVNSRIENNNVEEYLNPNDTFLNLLILKLLIIRY